MTDPFLTLLGANFRRWIGSRGFVMVAVAALFPLALTGAWVGTHQSDVSAPTVTWDPAQAAEGQNVTFTGTVVNTGSQALARFNATLSVGQVVGNTLRAEATNSTEVEGLQPGQARTVSLVWQARAGTYWVLLDADTGDAVGEVDEFNNQKPLPFVVQYKAPDAAATPSLPGNLTGGANATSLAGAAITDLVLPSSIAPGGAAKFTATVVNNGPDTLTNATVIVRVGSAFGTNFFPRQDKTEQVTLAPGASQQVVLDWPAASAGAYFVQAYVNVSAAQRDADAGDNARQAPVLVQPVIPADFTPPAPPEKLTIKDFYLNVLTFVHLRVLIPLIALFFAAGIIADERETGALPYLLTRPVPRWAIPVAKFLAGFAVAAIAVVIGLVGAFALLFGQPGGDIGYLTTPLFVSLLALFVYGAFFVLLGTVVDRPYLVGLAFVIGWEVLAPNFVPWVGNLTIIQHVGNVIQGWHLDQGLQWLPEGPDATQALLLILVVGVGFLALSAAVMKRREFTV